MDRASETRHPTRMQIQGDGQALRIFIGQSEQWQGRMPLHEAIVRKIREAGLAGATVIRALDGFGAHSRTYGGRVLSEDRSIVIEVVDRAERIQAILPVIDLMVVKGLITLEPVQIVAYRTGATDHEDA
jgi:PII-like signaling protein